MKCSRIMAIKRIKSWIACFAGLSLLLGSVFPSMAQNKNVLPSWAEGKTKSAIVNFVTGSNILGQPGFIPPEQRIAFFDFDGTLWAEDPIARLIFSIEQMKLLLPEHPEWKDNRFVSIAMKADIRAIEQQWDSTFSTLDSLITREIGAEEYAARVVSFLAEARHPKFRRLFRETTYLPMRELLTFLADNGFTAYIVSASGAGFIRAFSQEAFGITPDRVIADPSAVKHGPVISCANARHSGDLDLLMRGRDPSPRSLQILINHDDISREYFYGDRDGKAAAAAAKYGWTVVSMRRDWKQIFSL